LFVFLPCWLVGFWIFNRRKTDKNITMALSLLGKEEPHPSFEQSLILFTQG
jgi:hypothetical protein